MLNWYEIVLRLLLAAIFGALIGLERERKHWAAGLRTHMMVCVGACLIMIVSAFGFSDILGTPHVDLDPSRIAAQVVSGIGFIGAGAILFSKQETIRGITTASGIWTVAAIGLATGSGLYFAACITTLIALIILWALQPLEYFYFKKYEQKSLRIITNSTIKDTSFINNILKDEELKIQTFTCEKNEQEFIYHFRGNDINAIKTNQLMEQLKQTDGIKEISWI